MLKKIQISKHQIYGKRMFKAQLLGLFLRKPSMEALVQRPLESEWSLDQILNSFMSTHWFQISSLYLWRLINFDRVERKPFPHSGPDCLPWLQKVLLTVKAVAYMEKIPLRD